MSDKIKDKDSEQQELATNRLLDLLRSQQVGAREDEPAPPVAEKKPVEADSVETAAKEEPTIEVDDEILVPEPDSDPEAGGISSRELLDTLADALKADADSAEKDQEPEQETRKSAASSKTDAFSKNLFDELKFKTEIPEEPVSEDAPPLLDLLQKTDISPDEPKTPATEKETIPAEEPVSEDAPPLLDLLQKTDVRPDEPKTPATGKETIPAEEPVSEDALPLLDLLQKADVSPDKPKTPAAGKETVSFEPVTKAKPGIVEETHSDDDSVQGPPVVGDLLTEIQVQPVGVDDAEEEEIQPVEFDSRHFTPLPKSALPTKNQLTLNYIKRYLNESRHRLSIVIVKDFIHVVEVETTTTHTIIVKATTYSLPFEGDDGPIYHVDDLLDYILKNEIKTKNRKSLFAAMYHSAIKSRTRLFQTPVVKKSEIKDLVIWNIKKAIPFKPEDAAINWQIGDVIEDVNKQHILVGVVEKPSLEDLISKFKNYKIKLRLFSTLPILLWKNFIHNYPDYKAGAYALVHIGINSTTVVVVINHEFVFSREIVLGAQDFYQAIQQKIMVKGKSVEITEEDSFRILHEYGIPKDKSGVIPKLGVSLYKLSIFLRPAVERLVNEIIRSKSFFAKQSPDMEWDGILIDGQGATFPNLPDVLTENLEANVEILNPTRFETFKFADDVVIRENEISSYSMNFALLNDKAESLNILPKSTLTSYKFIFLSKLAIAIGAFFLPFFITMLMISQVQLRMLKNEVTTKTAQWETLSVQSQEYFDILKDLDIIDGYYKLLKNDRIQSRNILSIMKMLSNNVSDDIKFTSLIFKKELIDKNKPDVNNPNNYDNVVKLSGFVKSDQSIADIQLTNFQIQIDQAGIFDSIEREIKETSESKDEWKLFFQFTFRW